MGSNSLQGWGVLFMLVAFTALSLSMFYGGSVLWLLMFVVSFAASIGIFLKAKALES